MANRAIPPTDGIEMYLNENLSIVLMQQPVYEDKQYVVIHPKDVETVRQWLAELLAEAQYEAGL